MTMIEAFLSLFSSSKENAKPKVHALRCRDILRIDKMNPTQREMLKKEYEEFKEMVSEISSKERKEKLEKIDKKNNTCEGCGSTEVIDKIKRGKGSINGSGSGSVGGIGFLGTGVMSGSFSGSVKGDYDTLPVRQCTKCGNEWAKEKNDYNYFSREQAMDEIATILRAADRAENDVEWDPNDLDEKYGSLEEKKEAAWNDLVGGKNFWYDYLIERYSKFSQELIAYVADDEWSHSWHEHELARFNRSKIKWLEVITKKKIADAASTSVSTVSK